MRKSFSLFLASIWLGLFFSLPGCEPSSSTPKAKFPDLVLNNVSTNGVNFLKLRVENQGEGKVNTDKGLLRIFLEGEEALEIKLKDLPDSNYRTPGGKTNLLTGIRLSSERSHQVAVVLDPENAILESNEFQNTITKTIRPRMHSGPDFVIEELQLLQNDQVSIVVANIGNRVSAADFKLSVEVIIDNGIPSTFDVNLPALAPGLSTQLVPSNTFQINGPSFVEVKISSTDLFAELDNSNNISSKWLGRTIDLDPYRQLLSQNKLANRIQFTGPRGRKKYTEWTQGEKNDLMDAIKALEEEKNPSLSKPPRLRAGNEIGREDAWKIYIATIAQSLWVDVNNKVKWKLLNYSDKELSLLFDGSNLMSYVPANDRYKFDHVKGGGVTAWCPQIGYEFMENLGIVDSKPRKTLYKLTDWMVGHLIHINSSDDKATLYEYQGEPPVDKILYPLPDMAHVSTGCWGTTGLYNALLRTVNIPVELKEIRLKRERHSRPEFPSVNRSMAHGDDPYSFVVLPSGRAIPSDNMFYNLAEMEKNFIQPDLDCVGDRCNTVSEQASYNTGRNQRQTAFNFKGDGILYRLALRGEPFMDEFLSGVHQGNNLVVMAKPFFEKSKRKAMIAEMTQYLTDLGAGDLKKGKEIVTIRVERFLKNKKP